MKGKNGLLVLAACLISGALSLLFFFEKPLSAEPIRVGVILPVTGWAGAFGEPAMQTITVMVEDVNRRGGVLGRQIELYPEDDQSNPTNAAVAVTKLIRDKKVSAVLGSMTGDACMSMIPTLEREQVPGICLSASREIVVPVKKWIFQTALTDNKLSAAMLDFAVNGLGARKIALMHSLDSGGANGALGITENIGKYGASIVITEKFDPKDTNMIPQLTKIKAAQPDVVLLYVSSTPAGAVIAKNYHQLGMEMPVLTSHGLGTPQFMNLAGKLIEGGRFIIFGLKDMYAVELMSPDDPYRRDFLDPLWKLLKDKYGRTDYTGAGTFNGYDAVQMLVGGLKKAGTDDRAALRDGIEKMTLQGAQGDYVYSPTNHGVSKTAAVPIMIVDGKWRPYKQ